MGYFERVKSSFFGVIIGIILIPASLCLHAWNEYRTVHRSRGLAEAAELVQTVENTKSIEPSLEGSLVHMTGLADTNAILEDNKFPITEKAIHLRRDVQMYQWVETSKRRDDRTEYSYREQWSSGREASESFHEPEGHRNPQLKYGEREVSAKTVTLDAFQINQELVDSIDAWETIELNTAALQETFSDEELKHFQFSPEEIYWSYGEPNPAEPQIGDLKITFRHVPPSQVSLIAMQRGESFSPFETSNGEKIQRLYVGDFTAEEVMEKLMTENTVLAWILRLVGLGLCVGGFALIMKPLSTLVSFLPFLESLTGGLIFLVALLLGMSISVFTIGVAWIAVRPVLGISLLVLAGLGCYLIYRVQQKTEPPTIDESMLVS